MESLLVCAQCQSRSFNDVGFSLVCQYCGLQVEKQTTRYETDERSFLPNPKLNNLALRKKNTIKERIGKRGKRKEAETEKLDEDWSDYLEAYQKILKLHGDAAKDCLEIEDPNAFDTALKKVWFEYLDKWAKSGIRLQGGLMNERRGCFTMPQYGSLQKRYFIDNENVQEMNGNVITREGAEEYEKLYEKDYENLRSKFYKGRHKKT